MIRWAVRVGDWLGSKLPTPHDARLALAVRLLCGQPIIYSIEINFRDGCITSVDGETPIAGSNFALRFAATEEPMPWDHNPEVLS